MPDILQNTLHIFLTAITFIVMLMVLVGAHEFGHYLFARLFKMGVEEFAIGMGGKPWIYARRSYTLDLKPDDDPHHRGIGMGLEGGTGDSHEPVEVLETPEGRKLLETTRFTLRPWPIGGFVRIKGMVPDADATERTIPGGFYTRPAWQRFIVLLMGPAFSVGTGVVFLFFLYMAMGIQEPTTIVDAVAPKSPAASAKLQKGDRVVRIENQPISKFYELQIAVRDRVGQPTEVVIERGGREMSLQLTPTLSETPSPVMDSSGKAVGEPRRLGIIGVRPTFNKRPVTVADAATKAIDTPRAILAAIAGTFTRVDKLKENLGGPISMVRATNEAVKLGPADVVGLAAVLSISVGFLNLLPIFPLDGGQMMVAVVEAIRRGRPLSLNALENLGRVGFAAILLLMVTAFALDIGRLLPKPKAPAVETQSTP